ncbi:M14 family metallopeptidase [Cytobacillus firmus]|nr:M14 family metallopeptidase [Cytobacillus firmus]
MDNILEIWTKEGLLRDTNDDGVIDGIAVFIDLPDHLAPEGLIDFCARLGYETTSLSLRFFENGNSAVKMSFIYSDVKTEIRLENQEIIVRYKSEAELTDLLRLLAAMDPEESNGTSAAIELKNGKLVAGPVFIKSIEGRGEEENPEINSLSDLWSFSGVGKINEASPSKLLYMNVSIEESIKTVELIKGLCYFAARSAMYSTDIVFPLTGDYSTGGLLLEVLEDSSTSLELKESNVLQLKGRKESIGSAAHHLAKEKHWSDGGAFGYWEQRYNLNQKIEAPLLFEAEWEDVHETELAYRILKDSEDLAGADIEIFLSEPSEIRRYLEKKWKELFPEVNTLKIRSAFKAGMNWLVEEVMPELRESLKTVHGLEIIVKKESGENGLELPIRWIQEMYPVDSLIEEEYGLKATLVNYKLDTTSAHTYLVFRVDEQGIRHFVSSLDVPVSKLPYLDGKHYVYPVSSAVRVRTGEGVVREQLIQTDRERFYRFYTEEVLPRLRREIADYKDGQGHTQPLFDRIEIDVWMSEEECKLSIDEERISSLEALHEDLYFNTLDYFVILGEELEGKSFNAPGGVHPFMHVREGEKPKAHIRVYNWEDKPLENWVTTSIRFDEEGALTEAVMTNLIEEITLPVESFVKPLSHIHPEVHRWLSEQNSYRVLYPDHSYHGYAIPIIECFKDAEEEFYSPLKMSLFKKTIFIEAGHHSNEVSSTPAVLKLIEIADNRLGDWLKDINLVILPLANPDGYELVTKLTEEHPEWKHHSARYNAVGLEYSFVRFQKTVFGEANIYPEVLRRWAPDVIVDDHGIPAHEWVQPFAGYNSPPRFPVSYFLPSARIYGIGRLSSGDNRDLHAANLEAIVGRISQYITGTKIEKENKYWQERFKKYGNQWLPDVFPIEEAPGISFYRKGDVAPSYSTIGISRYPDWIAAEVISEAADEVVYGEVLDSCIEAHIILDLAILDVLLKTGIEVKRNGLLYERMRPIKLR